MDPALVFHSLQLLFSSLTELSEALCVIFLPNQSRNQSLEYKARIKHQPIYQLLSLINLQTCHPSPLLPAMR